MTATYFGHGKGRSIAASEAERDGRQPLSRAKQTVADAYDCTQAVAAEALRMLHDGEWHHVGKYAAECTYYDTADVRLGGVIRHIKACGGLKKFEERRRSLQFERAQSHDFLERREQRLYHERKTGKSYGGHYAWLDRELKRGGNRSYLMQWFPRHATRVY
jgi:hypothetical protein